MSKNLPVERPCGFGSHSRHHVMQRFTRDAKITIPAVHQPVSTWVSGS